MQNIKEYVNIKDYSTLKIGGQFRYFVELDDVKDIENIYAFAKSHNVPVLILGGGSNMVFSDGVIEILAVKMKLLGFKVVSESTGFSDIQVSAGENWDNFVSRTVDMGLSGIELLSAIPGTVGATPVQNVGAYGSEVKDTILSVEVFDTKENILTSILNKDCKFGYRDSIFKNEAKGKYLILSVTYRLLKITPTIPNYPGVKKYFIDMNINAPSLKQIRGAIISIRCEKLPNPNEIPNVGSFFKNPIVDKNIAEEIKIKYPNAKFFEVDEKLIKIPAGWLIENSGLKGKSFGKISVYEKNALVLVNNDGASKEDLINAKNEIIKIVKEKFGITLEQEPEMI
jgi:UDP-N-acetylmuramate dehydrogenase